MTLSSALAERFSEQARACSHLGSPMYAALLERCAQDITEGGPSAELLAAYDSAPAGAAVPLRLTGALHRLVLERAAPALALHYPSVGGTFAGVEASWPAVVGAFEAHGPRIAELLTRVPQTNEVGRAAALAGGLRHVAAAYGPDMVLVELGASAGLNLAVDRFRIEGAGTPWGPTDSPVQLAGAWAGNGPPDAPVAVRDRWGVDLHPVDVARNEGRLHLTSYVWADQVARFERLRAALLVAADLRVEVRRADAADAVEALSLREDVTTVVWHSIFWQYVPPEGQARIRARLEELAQGGGRLAYLRLEEGPGGPERLDGFEVRLRLGDGPDRVLATAPPHGLPVQWV